MAALLSAPDVPDSPGATVDGFGGGARAATTGAGSVLDWTSELTFAASFDFGLGAESML